MARVDPSLPSIEPLLPSCRSSSLLGGSGEENVGSSLQGRGCALGPGKSDADAHEPWRALQMTDQASAIPGTETGGVAVRHDAPAHGWRRGLGGKVWPSTGERAIVFSYTGVCKAIHPGGLSLHACLHVIPLHLAASQAPLILRTIAAARGLGVIHERTDARHETGRPSGAWWRGPAVHETPHAGRRYLYKYHYRYFMI